MSIILDGRSFGALIRDNLPSHGSCIIWSDIQNIYQPIWHRHWRSFDRLDISPFLTGLWGDMEDLRIGARISGVSWRVVRGPWGAWDSSYSPTRLDVFQYFDDFVDALMLSVGQEWTTVNVFSAHWEEATHCTAQNPNLVSFANWEIAQWWAISQIFWWAISQWWSSPQDLNPNSDSD